jgi:hypothetical protein
MEGKVMLAKLIQVFDFKLDMAQSFHAVEYLTMRPKDGCKCRLTVRE